MIDKIKSILSTIENIDEYKIIENKIDSGELFFIRKNLDMNRAKTVHSFSVTIYKDFEENGVTYRGSSTTTIHPTMSDEEVLISLKDAAFAAGFIKNEYYPLAEPSESLQFKTESNLSKAPIESWLPKITEAIYKEDIQDNGCINSTEIFLSKTYNRIVNSKGIDVSYEGFKGEVEFITDWKESDESIELYKHFSFSEFHPEDIETIVSSQLKISRERAIAKTTPMINKINVLLTGTPVQEIFNFYYMQASAQNIYNNISDAKLNENIQGEQIEGDLVSITLDPALENSTNSSPYDSDGFPLRTVKIFEDGVLKRYWGDVRHCHYLNITPTGIIRNIIVEGGKNSAEAFRKEPYLELVAFSDFQMDDLTGDFGGEIRLGWYFDGKNTIPVTGGSISGNIKEIQRNIYFSKEIQKNNNFWGPKTIKLPQVSVSGIS